MFKILITKLRHRLSDHPDKMAAVEKIVIQHNKRNDAQLVPFQPENWRERMTIVPQVLVSVEEFIRPIEELRADD
jgi:hypothetical protein